MDELGSRAETIQSFFSYLCTERIDAALGSAALVPTEGKRSRFVTLPKGKGENIKQYHSESDSLQLVPNGKVGLEGT